MSLPLFLVPSLPVDDGFVLEGPEGHHAAAVQRLRAGEELLLGDGRGGTARAVVTAAFPQSLRLEIVKRAYEAQATPRLVVAQGIAKGERAELAVQAMTEVGVDEILPWAAARSVALWKGERGARSREKWVATAREAAKQGRRAWIPVIGGSPDVATRDLKPTFVLHEEATERLSTVDLPDAEEIVLVVGPEGGIDDRELKLFLETGAAAVRLGDNVLRTSTAGVAALSVLATRLGRW
ncbi:MAG TPA: 16S rRNA (uracil(1498)-N(3))-methyltransferase [Candidatus Limnocylindrales bacterium]|nr:16S rRNA (uracil(1498)-N(3))-methyltransferase [Candidatus Limnocylindrales bacterium]